MTVIGWGITVNIENITSNFFKMPKEIEENYFHQIFESDHEIYESYSPIDRSI